MMSDCERRISIDVPGGTLIAGVEESTDYPCVYIAYRPHGFSEVDIAVAEVKTDTSDNPHSDIDVYLYEDETSDDYSRTVRLDRRKIITSMED